jgi:1-acyl-sn-glycerol-3-phosphate acyltransferase
LNVIPVNQEGIDRSALKALIRVLKAGNAALVFPEGARTLDGKLQPAEPGLGLVIAKTLAPVVPMRIFGAHDALPRGEAAASCPGHHRYRRADFFYGSRH